MGNQRFGLVLVASIDFSTTELFLPLGDRAISMLNCDQDSDTRVHLIICELDGSELEALREALTSKKSTGDLVSYCLLTVGSRNLVFLHTDPVITEQTKQLSLHIKLVLSAGDNTPEDRLYWNDIRSNLRAISGR